jgi:hypothetical protein
MTTRADHQVNCRGKIRKSFPATAWREHHLFANEGDREADVIRSGREAAHRTLPRRSETQRSLRRKPSRAILIDSAQLISFGFM